MTIEIHLDAVASLITFGGGTLLAVDVLTVGSRTRLRRGGEKLLEGLKKEETSDEDHNEHKQNPLQTPDGEAFDSDRALEDWAGRLRTRTAVWGFVLLACGLGFDLFTKVVCNPLLFSK